MAFSFGFGGDSGAAAAGSPFGAEPSPFGGGAAAATSQSGSGPATSPDHAEAECAPAPVESATLPEGQWRADAAAAPPAGWARSFCAVELPPWCPSATGAPLGAAVTDLASRGVPVLYAPDASAGGDLPPGWAVSKGQYEGGLVQWECAGDAAAVIVGAAVAGSALSGPGGADEAGPKGLFAAGTAGAALGRAMATSRLTIVEVGCGTALPTAAALRLRALAPGSADQCTRAVLQDLNAPALSLKAGPSVAHAAELPQAGAAAAPAAPKEVRLLSGSWGAAMDDALADAAVAGCRDGGALVVVASETVYRAEAVAAHTASLLGLLERGRAAGMGPCVCVVAAKRFYFGSGLGGGTRAFAEAAEAWTPAGGGSRPVLWRALSVDDGKSNVRDVWVVSLSD
ncbi:hypothetical protein FNF28_06644 [Cafeteria roenbergensis]|uniref:Uncharacterized protein n=1 Tax=Cafeteria roenbergensis TaxID=33653 RepID=A0A5A8CVI6_CAFRO|nr:hypothetical protein FNF28_06644 [Cafeteria roenbergensis]